MTKGQPSKTDRSAPSPNIRSLDPCCDQRPVFKDRQEILSDPWGYGGSEGNTWRIIHRGNPLGVILSSIGFVGDPDVNPGSIRTWIPWRLEVG